MAHVPTLDEIAANPELAKDLSPPVAADLLARLAGVQALLLSRLLTGNGTSTRSESQGEDRLLTVSDGAARLGVSEDWLYRRADKLPFTVRLGTALRFSSHGIDRYIRQQQRR